ncbi:MAG TPA: DUF1801 domain-containing protein [Chloroflexota bacterium]|nr:DUF1801 domain-containing protein [Chloroflexota bacterium]
MTERDLIERYFQAMRTGAIASDEIIGLFVEEAVYVEPFGGTPMEHVGTDDIRRNFIESQQRAPADMTLTLDQVDIEPDCIRSVWTCTSPAFPHPMRGQDLWTIRDGKIHRLETSFLTTQMSTVDDYLVSLHPSQAPVVRALCEVIRRAAPDARESIKWAQPVWEVNGPACSVKAFKNYTNVNFWRGAELAKRADRDRSLLGEGGRMRHIRVESIDDVREEALQHLVRAAVELNQRFGNPTRGEATRARD